MKELNLKIAVPSPIQDGEAAPTTAGSSAMTEPELERLYRFHQWFELRDAIGQGCEMDFYAAVVAAVFNEVEECKKRLHSIIERGTASRQACEARRLLAWMYARRGEFENAFNELQALAALQGQTAGLAQGIELYAALARYPRQRAVERGLSGLPYIKLDGYIFVPLQVNGRAAHFMIDSGANISLITESQARELGLSIEEVPANATRMYGVTGEFARYRTASINELTLGRYRIENAVFIVVEDDQFDFPLGFGGALGLPVLLALSTLRWTRNGTFETGFAAAAKRLSKCNLAFDNSDCIVQVFSSGKKFNLLLDTGNNQTTFWPPFAVQFKQIISAASSGRLALTGVSGAAMVEHHLMPQFKLRIGGFELGTENIPVLRQVTTPNSRWLSGHLGIDLLAQCERVTLDFTAMKLSME